MNLYSERINQTNRPRRKSKWRKSKWYISNVVYVVMNCVQLAYISWTLLIGIGSEPTF